MAGRAAGLVDIALPKPTGVKRRALAFLSYCLQVTLRRRLHAQAPGLTPRAVLEKFAAMQMIDVTLMKLHEVFDIDPRTILNRNCLRALFP